jgi:hypothetical protein
MSCFYLKHNVSETGFGLRLQVETTQLGRIDRVSPYFCPEIGSSCVDWEQLSRSHLKTETDSGLRIVVCFE